MRVCIDHFWLLTFVSSCLFSCGRWLGQGLQLSHNKAVVCYVGTWSVYRPGRGSFNIDDIPPDLCTHVVYAFVGINSTSNTLRSIDPYFDLEENYGKGSFKKMTKLKLKNPQLKVTLAVGGWNEGSFNYSTMALSSASRKAFTSSVVEYLRKYNFDGFDLDWEFPAARGGRKEDKQNFVALVKELKTELKKHNWILTAAIGAAPGTIKDAYDVLEISKHLDLIHFMCYDYHGPWDKSVGPNAPLNSKDNLSVEYSVKHLLELGAPPEKLVLGIPAYGHTFLSDDPDSAAIGAPAQEPGPEGQFTKQKGFQGYNEICMEFAKNRWSTFWDENSTTPYATNGNHVISFDNERSVKAKVELGLRYRLGGFMLWSIDTDDFHGDCENAREDQHGGSSSTYPLLRAIHRTIREYDWDDKKTNDVNTNSITDKSPKSAAAPVAFTISWPVIILVHVLWNRCLD